MHSSHKKSWTVSKGGEARGVHTIWRKLQSKLARGVVVALKKNILLGGGKMLKYVLQKQGSKVLRGNETQMLLLLVMGFNDFWRSILILILMLSFIIMYIL